MPDEILEHEFVQRVQDVEFSLLDASGILLPLCAASIAACCWRAPAVDRASFLTI
jgi:hypothetical protein